jgi:PIN domain nuclease of toxin-antitoxin system
MGGRILMLLDTCALLWLAEGGLRISRETRERIEAAAVVYVSAISAFEIAIKCRSGKLKLPVPPGEWFLGVVEHHGLAIQPLDWDICLAAAELPPVHKDPCDRFIIATAKLYRLTVVTGDPVFGTYGIHVAG